MEKRLSGQIPVWPDKNRHVTSGAVSQTEGHGAVESLGGDLVEVKLGGDKLIEEGAGNLLELAGRINTDKMNDPSFMMVLVGVGDYAYRRKDGIYIIYSTYRLFEGLSLALPGGVRLRTLIAGDVGMALARKRQGFLPTI